MIKFVCGKITQLVVINKYSFKHIQFSTVIFDKICLYIVIISKFYVMLKAHYHMD